MPLLLRPRLRSRHRSLRRMQKLFWVKANRHLIGGFMLRGLLGIMSKRFSLNLGTGLRFSFWPTALIGIVVIKAVLSLDVKPGSFVLSYSGISYFLLLSLAAGFAIRNGIQ